MSALTGDRQPLARTTLICSTTSDLSAGDAGAHNTAIHANPIEFHAWDVCNLPADTTSIVSFVSLLQQLLEKSRARPMCRLQRIAKPEKVNSIMGMIIARQQLETGFKQRL
jgi:hypothetical protein